jgi:ABC-type branched-subunit amino acid transport system substrate-binding protein
MGVDIVVGAAGDTETEVANQVLEQENIIQIHAVAQAVELSNGADYTKRLQTTPILSQQGELCVTYLHFK